jgi:hypothetical protein
MPRVGPPPGQLTAGQPKEVTSIRCVKSNKGTEKAFNLTHSWGWPRLHDDIGGRKGVDSSPAALWQEVDERFVDELRDPTKAAELLAAAAAIVNDEPVDRRSKKEPDDDAETAKPLLWKKHVLEVADEAKCAWFPGGLLLTAFARHL